MNSRCDWIDTIKDQSRKMEVDRLREILKNLEVGILHVFGDERIGKRTLIECLARDLLSGESDFARIVMVDLLSDPLRVDEWNVKDCDWMTFPNLPSRSLMGVLQVLFHDCVEREVEGASQMVSLQERVLIVLRDYGSPDFQKRTIEEEAVQQIQCIMKQKRLVLVLLSEANLLDRGHNESQRLGDYRRLFYATKGWQFKVGLLSTEAEAKSAIKLSFQLKKPLDKLTPKPTNNQMNSVPIEEQINAVLEAAGPHPGQIDQAVGFLASHTNDTPLVQYLADDLLQANKTVYEATWDSLQQREQSVLLTYGLIKRDRLSRVEAQAKLDRQTEDFTATDTDFHDVEKKRNDPWSRVGQCLLPWKTTVEYKFFSEAFASFVVGKLPPESSLEPIPNWRAYLRTPMFLVLVFFASMAVGLVILLLTIMFDLPRLLAVCIPLLPVALFFVFFLISYLPVSRFELAIIRAFRGPQ